MSLVLGAGLKGVLQEGRECQLASGPSGSDSTRTPSHPMNKETPVCSLQPALLKSGIALVWTVKAALPIGTFQGKGMQTKGFYIGNRRYSSGVINIKTALRTLKYQRTRVIGLSDVRTGCRSSPEHDR